MPTGC